MASTHWKRLRRQPLTSFPQTSFEMLSECSQTRELSSTPLNKLSTLKSRNAWRRKSTCFTISPRVCRFRNGWKLRLLLYSDYQVRALVSHLRLQPPASELSGVLIH